MGFGYQALFSAIIGVALISISAFILLPNRMRIPTYLTTIAAILSIVLGLFFIFLAAQLYAGG